MLVCDIYCDISISLNNFQNLNTTFPSSQSYVIERLTVSWKKTFSVRTYVHILLCSTSTAVNCLYCIIAGLVIQDFNNELTARTF